MNEQESVAAPAAPQAPAYQAPVEAEQPKKSGGVIKKILGLVVVALIVIAVKVALGSGLGALWDNITGSVATAEVGDCVNTFDKVEDAKVVDCTDAAAANKVVGVIEGVSEIKFNTQQNTLCDAYPTWETVVWIGRTTDGDAWCMEPIKK
jgi:hypothetical protein